MTKKNDFLNGKLLIYLWMINFTKEEVASQAHWIQELLSKYKDFIILIGSDLYDFSSGDIETIDINPLIKEITNLDTISLYPLLANSAQSLNENLCKLESILESLHESSNSGNLNLVEISKKEILTNKAIEIGLPREKIIQKKEHELRTLLSSCTQTLNEKPGSVHKHTTLAQDLLEAKIEAPVFFFSEEKQEISDMLFYSRMKQLLSAHVELMYFIHDQTDPVTGWLEVKSDEHIFELKNPFLSLTLDIQKYGLISLIEYYPRKTLLLEGAESAYCCITEEETLHEDILPHHIQGTSTQAIRNEEKKMDYKIIRRQSDLYAVRFDEPIVEHFINSSEKAAQITCCKVFYIKSGLGSFVQNSTTGFTLEYWLENLNETKESSLFSINLPILFPGDKETISMRALSAMGGEDNKLHYLKDIPGIIRSEEIQGGLFGLRIINSVSHFVIDYRFARPINVIKYHSYGDSAGSSLINLSFSQKPQSLSGYERLQEMHFSIY